VGKILMPCRAHPLTEDFFILFYPNQRKIGPPLVSSYVFMTKVGGHAI
jgi:hypothetical protein